MSLNESVLIFMRFVTEKHKDVILSLDQLVQTLVGENETNKIAKAEDALKKAMLDLYRAYEGKEPKFHKESH